MPAFTQIPLLPVPPTTSDAENFRVRADQFLSALPGFGENINTVAGEINTSITIAEAVGNFQGAWSSGMTALAGRSYSYGGKIWVCISDTATDPSSNNPLYIEIHGHPSSKNYIINGDFRVWQRGVSQTTAGYGSDDRWSNGNIGSTKTHSQVKCDDSGLALFNRPYFSRTAVNSVSGAGNYASKSQKIEDVTRLAGKTVIVSFYAKADVAKEMWVEHKQNFGTGGTPSAEVTGISPKTIALTTSWQRFSYTITLPSLAGKTLGTDGVHTSSTALQFWFEGGSNYTSLVPGIIQQSGTFDIAMVEMKEGSEITPYEDRHIGEELVLCERYFRYDDSNVINIAGGAGGSKYGPANAPYYFAFNLPFQNTMRVAPTTSIVGTVTYVNSSALDIDASVNGIYGRVTVGGSSGSYRAHSFGVNSSAEL